MVKQKSNPQAGKDVTLGAQRGDERMFGYLVAALLLFPWVLAIHIAVGAFRVTRRRANAHKQIDQIGTRSCR